MSRWSDDGVVQAQTVASTRTCLPGAKSLPSTVDTLMRSLLSSEWHVPEVPSAQELAMVFGWLGSGPRVPRPRSSAAPESHELPTVPHLGARRVASKTAVCGPPPPPVGVMVSEMFTLCVSAPLVPRAWKLAVPGVAVAPTATVSVLEPEPGREV